jgi:hypothetical protein
MPLAGGIMEVSTREAQPLQHRSCILSLFMGSNASVRLQAMPCAAFIVNPDVMANVDRQLSKRLSQNLSTQFRPSPAQNKINLS